MRFLRLRAAFRAALATPSLLAMTAASSLALCLAAGACGPAGDGAAGEAPDPAPDHAASQVPRGEPPAFFLGGIQVNEDDHQEWLDALEHHGMNTVSVTDYAHQGDWDTDHMWWEEDNPGMLAEIRAAKARGLHVVMILRVALDHAFERNQFLWHGMIMPRTEEQLASWFEQYTRFALHWAEVAQREGVDVLMIGSEMNALASTLELDELPALEEYFLDDAKQEERREQMLSQEEIVERRHLTLPERDAFPDLETYLDERIRIEQEWARQVTATGVGGDADGEDDGARLAALNHRRALLERHWETLIETLRGVYDGPLGYAANFDQYHEVGFWPALDVMGVNAYFKLRDQLVDEGDEATLRTLLEEGWRGVLGDLETFRNEQGIGHLPLIFTEMGFTYRANSTVEPWADTGFALVATGPGEDAEKQLVVWREQPIDHGERALAVSALHTVHSRLAEPFLEGILYWKLSTHDYHAEVESFMLWIGEESDDPLIDALTRFRRDDPTPGPVEMPGREAERDDPLAQDPTGDDRVRSAGG